jgi:hypothetical protein
MKKVGPTFLVALVLIACENSNLQKPEIDTHSSSDVSQTVRNQQIDKAKNNRTYLLGKWKVTEVRSGDEAMTKLSLSELDFDEMQFTPNDSFKVAYKGKGMVAGSVEWMAEDREIVMTADNIDAPRRMLIKNVNDQYLKLKFNGYYYTFKKVK